MKIIEDLVPDTFLSPVCMECLEGTKIMIQLRGGQYLCSDCMVKAFELLYSKATQEKVKKREEIYDIKYKNELITKGGIK